MSLAEHRWFYCLLSSTIDKIFVFYSVPPVSHHLSQIMWRNSLLSLVSKNIKLSVLLLMMRYCSSLWLVVKWLCKCLAVNQNIFPTLIDNENSWWQNNCSPTKLVILLKFCHLIHILLTPFVTKQQLRHLSCSISLFRFSLISGWWDENIFE